MFHRISPPSGQQPILPHASETLSDTLAPRNELKPHIMWCRMDFTCISQGKCVKWLAAHNTDIDITLANFPLRLLLYKHDLQKKHEAKSCRKTTETEYELIKFRNARYRKGTCYCSTADKSVQILIGSTHNHLSHTTRFAPSGYKIMQINQQKKVR